MTQEQYDFYFSKQDRIKGYFSGKVYSEYVPKDTAPKSKACDLLHVGTGTLENVQEFWRG